MTMEIAASRDTNGIYHLEMGPVTFALNEEAVEGLHKVLDQRLNRGNDLDAENMKRKLEAYRLLASKMSGVDDRIVQQFAPQVTPEQLVTIVRLSDGDTLYQKVLRNLSKQNRRQFEEDFAALDKITEQNACIYMEQLVPMIKKAAQQQKALQNEMLGR